ncbi:hypothetical protein OCOJLMKI_1468 [Methylobacterium iners]|uniref:Uncharacterized protein n=1 Tax=Methylobacterium iners TaxID=418707 RepID=A0ABQ4RTY6_9HYPH|nr:hypothetical protein OCOJLMKI_1468 [Methylobacterium iners]
MQRDEAVQVHGDMEHVPRPKRDLVTPLVLLSGGILTAAWCGLLVWGVVSLVSYLFG